MKLKALVPSHCDLLFTSSGKLVILDTRVCCAETLGTESQTREISSHLDLLMQGYLGNDNTVYK